MMCPDIALIRPLAHPNLAHANRLFWQPTLDHNRSPDTGARCGRSFLHRPHRAPICRTRASFENRIAWSRQSRPPPQRGRLPALPCLRHNSCLIVTSVGLTRHPGLRSMAAAGAPLRAKNPSKRGKNRSRGFELARRNKMRGRACSISAIPAAPAEGAKCMGQVIFLPYWINNIDK